jgi:CBS domain-containing protein
MAHDNDRGHAELGKSKLAKVIHALGGALAQRVVRSPNQRVFVRQVMTPNPRTCTPSDSLHHAARIMWDIDCGCVPVVDAEGLAVAMITDRDICMAAYTQGAPLGQLPVASAASRTLVSVLEGDTLQIAESMMQQHRVRRLSVIDQNGRLVGIVSMSDLARYANFGDGDGERNAEPLARTLAAVSAPTPRRVS